MRLRSNVIAFAALTLLSMAPGAFGAFYQWSKTPGTNASADPTINWAEGQPPGSVNDSARAMMARTKEWADDNTGNLTLVTGGTSSAYTVSSFQVFSSLALMDQCSITIIVHAANADNATLNVDGLGAKAIQTAPSTGVTSGTLLVGVPYRMTYYNSLSAWRLHNFFGNALNVPVGAMVDYFGTSAPNSNFVFPVGQAISRTTYATLFALIGTTYGVGDGVTTFNLPDLRGKVTAALDNMGGSAVGVTGGTIGIIATDSGAINGQVLGSKGGSSSHVQTTAEMPAHAHGTTESPHTHVDGSTNTGALVAGGDVYLLANNVNHSTNGAVTGLSVNSAGGSNAMSILQPTFMINKLMRII